MGNSHGKPVIFTDQVNLNHFRLLRVVGKGAFGKVRIVERKDTGCTFALKYIRKDEVVRSESVRNIIRERRMLEHLNHPFLCNLRYSFQDVEYLYLVQDLMTGGDLRFHISRKTFTEEAVRFWVAELGCALRYIHSQGIVHRDVKPDNILLDADGHVHLADFNVASDFKPGKPLTSKSGTLAYLAPEVYEGRGYSCEVDWWSLGVTFYECIYSKRPFEANNHEALAAKIRQAEPPFPLTNPPVSNPCLHAISSLLEKDKNQRIGAAGFETFSDNPFFRAISFDALENKELEPVFKPSSDKTNFDATYDLEELLLEEAPLEARARRQKPREQLKVDATKAEIRADELHRMIEKLFEPFDYTLAQFDKSNMSESVTPTGTGGLSATTTATTGTFTNASPSITSGASPYAGISDFGPPSSSADPSYPYSHSSVPTPNGSPPMPHRDDLPTALPIQGARVLESLQQLPPRSVPHGSDVPFDPMDTRQPRSEHRSGKTRRLARSARRNPRGSSPTLGNDNGSATDLEFPLPPLPTGSDAPVVPEDGASSSKQQLGQQQQQQRPSGMLAFLSRNKKGRDKSPSAGGLGFGGGSHGKEKEKGVLGKVGARSVVNM